MNDVNRIEQEAADWLALKDRGPLSEDVEAAFEGWIEADVAHRVAYLRLDSAWRRADRLAALSIPGQAVKRPRGTVGRRRLWGPVLGLAAGVVLILGGYALLSQPWPSHLAAPPGGRASAPLADGSHVDLNEGARLKILLDNRNRHVRLEDGEAFFAVARDETRPFVVETDSVRVTVLGTRFSVRKDGAEAIVRVLDGMVSVALLSDRSNANLPRIARAGDEIVVSRTGIALRHLGLEAVSDRLEWRSGRIVFNEIALIEAVAEFNRYNTIQLVVADPIAADMRIGGAFEASNAETFANLLRDVYGMTVMRQRNEIIISSSSPGK